MASGTTAPWQPHEDAVFRRMWAAGESISVIGAALGRTRNAVAGRRGRLGLPMRGERQGGRGGRQTPYPEMRLRNVREARAKAAEDGRRKTNPLGWNGRQALPKLPGRDGVPPLQTPPIPMELLGHAACRYIGERPAVITIDTPIYCGAKTDGGSWCPEHRALVFQLRLK